MNKEQTDRHTKTKKKRSKNSEPPVAQSSPQEGKKTIPITAAFQSGGFSPFTPGSNCLFFSLVVLSLGLRLAFRRMVFDEFAGVVAVPARVPTCSVGEEMSPPWFNPMPTSK